MTPTPSKVTVYNLTVANDHSYFVANNGLWVHNSDNVVCDLARKDTTPSTNPLSQSQIDEILAIEKPNRPDPSTYLDEAYIASHLAKFDEGAVRFTKQFYIDTYGTLGSREAFTMPKSEFDDLLAETGGDLSQIEIKLGLNSGDLTSDDTVIAWIKKTDLGEVKIPSGNEGGVIDAFWIPGGKTSGGVSEGIVDLSNSNLPYTKL